MAKLTRTENFVKLGHVDDAAFDTCERTDGHTDMLIAILDTLTGDKVKRTCRADANHFRSLYRQIIRIFTISYFKLERKTSFYTRSCSENILLFFGGGTIPLKMLGINTDLTLGLCVGIAWCK